MFILLYLYTQCNTIYRNYISDKTLLIPSPSSVITFLIMLNQYTFIFSIADLCSVRNIRSIYRFCAPNPHVTRYRNETSFVVPKAQDAQ